MAQDTSVVIAISVGWTDYMYVLFWAMVFQLAVPILEVFANIALHIDCLHAFLIFLTMFPLSVLLLITPFYMFTINQLCDRITL